MEETRIILNVIPRIEEIIKIAGKFEIECSADLKRMKTRVKLFMRSHPTAQIVRVLCLINQP